MRTTEIIAPGQPNASDSCVELTQHSDLAGQPVLPRQCSMPIAATSTLAADNSSAASLISTQ